MAVFNERDVDLREDNRQTKELKRIADRVRKIAKRDFQSPIAVIIVSNGDEAEVKLGVEVEEEVIVEEDDE